MSKLAEKSKKDISTIQVGFPVSGLSYFEILGTKGSNLGLSLVGIGDVNGDGFVDFAVTSKDKYGYTEVHVIFGKDAATSLYSPDNVIINSSTFDGGYIHRIDEFQSVAAIGDINGDGLDDFAISTKPLALGYTHIIFGQNKANPWKSIDFTSLGSTEDFTSAGILRIEAESENDDFGHSIASLGNMTGSGEFAIAAPKFNSNAGAVYIIPNDKFLASESMVAIENLNTIRLNGNTGESLGLTVSGIGDINNDGTEDFLIKSRSSGSYVVFGQKNSKALQTLDFLNLEKSGVGFKITDSTFSSIVKLGDINGDGIDDFAVGDDWASHHNMSSAGSAYVIFGKDPQHKWQDIDLSPDGNFISGKDGFKISGGTKGEKLGNTIANIGDINGDGINDFAIGASGALNGTGRVYVFYGKSASRKWSDIDLRPEEGNFIPCTTGFIIEGESKGDHFGHAIASIGDIDGDGLNDFAVSTKDADVDGMRNAGKVYLMSSKKIADAWDIESMPQGFFNALSRSILNGDIKELNDLLDTPCAKMSYKGVNFNLLHLASMSKDPQGTFEAIKSRFDDKVFASALLESDGVYGIAPVQYLHIFEKEDSSWSFRSIVSQYKDLIGDVSLDDIMKSSYYRSAICFVKEHCATFFEIISGSVIGNGVASVMGRFTGMNPIQNQKVAVAINSMVGSIGMKITSDILLFPSDEECGLESAIGGNRNVRDADLRQLLNNDNSNWYISRTGCNDGDIEIMNGAINIFSSDNKYQRDQSKKERYGDGTNLHEDNADVLNDLFPHVCLRNVVGDEHDDL